MSIRIKALVAVMWLSGAVTACNSITPDPADLILVDGEVVVDTRSEQTPPPSKVAYF